MRRHAHLRLGDKGFRNVDLRMFGEEFAKKRRAAARRATNHHIWDGATGAQAASSRPMDTALHSPAVIYASDRCRRQCAATPPRRRLLALATHSGTACDLREAARRTSRERSWPWSKI